MAHGANTIRTTISAVSVPASSASSLSDDEIVYGTLQSPTNVQSRSYKKQIKSWNCPRKTIKAIDSMGRIEGRHSMEGSTWKNIAPNKCKKIKQHVKRYKRLLELAKPKSGIASNEISDSVMCFRKQKSSSKKQQRGPPKHNCLNSAKKDSNPAQKLTCKTVTKMNTLPNTLVYKTSEHTAKLAEPRDHGNIRMRLLGRVIESGLFAKAPKRLVELARPRKVITNISSDNTATRTLSGVSHKALNAVCSPRILKLSVPKNQQKLLSGNKRENKKIQTN